jgi:hypothetical protein
MIYRMMREIEADLQARKYPLVFVYNPANPRQTYGRRGVVEVERDTERGETFNPVVGVGTNPRRMGTRLLGVKWTIYAQSGLDGAMRNDHENECDLYVDAIQIALAEWGKVSGAGYIEVTEARYLSAAERDGADLTSDVAYLLRFAVPRGVVKKTYEGQARPSAAVSTAANGTLVSVSGSQYQEVP